jgi:two-component system phosphate regulon response regulator PhoB
MNNKKILVVDDEEDIVELITFQLERDGYHVICANDGIEAISKINKDDPDLVILDIMMPRMSGLDVVQLIRGKKDKKSLPIIIVSAKSTEDDIVAGLDFGADDYLTKPFSLKVLSAKVKAIFRMKEEQKETLGNNKNEEEIISFNDLTLNKRRHSCTLKENLIDLTATEFELLYLLAREPGRVFTRNQLINESKGNDYPVTQRAIDVQVVSLRKKLGDFGKNCIKTVWGIGYKLENEV